MAVTDPRIFAQSVGLGNLPQLYATNIQAPDISPIQRAQQLAMQEQQFRTSLAMRQQEFKQRERAFELDELERRLAFDDKLGSKFLSADMPTVYKVMDEIGLSQALEGPLKASEIVPLYKQFHQDERIQMLTAKKALTDNLLNYAKENKDVLGRNVTAYRDVVLSTASNPNATIQDLAAIDPRAFDYYDYRGLIEDQIAKNKDLTAEEKRQAIKNFITADPQARRQLILDGTVREGDTVDDIVDRLSSIYAVSGRDTAKEGGTASSAEFRGAYSPTGESYISEADRQKAASIISGSGSTKEERLQPMESAKTFIFDNLRNNKDWIEDQVSKVDIDSPLARDREGFLLFEGTPPSREELAQADKTVERIDGNIYIKVNTDAGTVYYDAGPDTQLVEDNSPETKSDNLVNEFAKRRESYRDDNSAEKFGKDFNTHVEVVKRFKEDLGRNPTLEEIEQIFGERSEITEMYKSAYESAGEAIDRSSTVERPSSQFNVPSTSEAMAPQDRSPLTGQPYDPYSNIGTGAYNQPVPLQGTQPIPAAAPVPPPSVPTEDINTTLDESEDEEGIVIAPAIPTERPRTIGPEGDARPEIAPAIPVERAKELVEDEEDVPVIDEVIRSVGSMSKSTIESIKEVTGVDLGELIAQGPPPAPAQTPPRASELGPTSPGGGGGGGGWGEDEPPNNPPNRATSGTTPEEETITRVTGEVSIGNFQTSPYIAEMLPTFKEHEGYRASVYKDVLHDEDRRDSESARTFVAPTIGYGFNLKAMPKEKLQRLFLDPMGLDWDKLIDGEQTLTEAQAEELLARRMTYDRAVISEVFPEIDDMPLDVQKTLHNMQYQLADGIAGWPSTMELIKQGKWEQAGDAIVNSLWFEQTPTRAAEAAENLWRQMKDKRKYFKWKKKSNKSPVFEIIVEEI